MSTHKAGFVSIVGKPNVGKSTLMNHLVGERLSIITAKAQTTRHRIMGIINTDDYQIVYSDTPGMITPKYELHKSMMGFVSESLSDADVILFVTDIFEKYDENEAVERVKNAGVPVILVINKIDLASQEVVVEKIEAWKERLEPSEILVTSALHNFNTQAVLDLILRYIPEHPAYYDKDELTDKPERFFVAEMIREQILERYDKEIPYSCEVVVTSFKESDDMIRISADIIVERQTQKGIIIGKGGEMLKRVGIGARKTLETFFEKKIYLETHVKVDADWRSDKTKLRKFGYDH